MPLVTPHFASEEFAQHAGYGLPSMPYPGPWIQDRLKPLCEALEIIRDAVGKPIRVLSGFRSAAYNVALYKAEGQKPTQSQHTQGRAADIVVDGMAAHDLHALILGLYKAGKIQIGGLGKYGTFVHVDTREGWNHLAQWEGHGA